MVGIVLFASFFVLLLFGVPVALSLAASGILAFLCADTSLIVVSQKLFAQVDQYSLMAIPFFMMAGGFLDKGGVSKCLVNFANSLVGWLPGGVAVVTMLASAFFGAISGSSAATVIAIGSIMVPAMIDRGYSEKFSLATIANSGYLGIIVPPSIPMVIYGIASNTSVGEVFLGGLIPGFLLAGGMSIYSVIHGRKHFKSTKNTTKFSLKEVRRTFVEAIWALIMPFIILGGIYGGIFTPTEAAAVASVYALLIGLFVYKELTWRTVGSILKRSVIMSAVVLFVCSGAGVFGLALTHEQLPVKVAQFIISIADSPAMFWLLITSLLLVIGTFLDTIPAVMILTPIISPCLSNYGISPVAFGVIMIILLGIGLVTPPVGLNLYVAAGLRKTTIEVVVNKHLWAYAALALMTTIVFMMFTEIVTWLPNAALG